jgi:hypothetical protein
VGKGVGGGKEGEMTQTLYAHMNKRNLKKETVVFIHMEFYSAMKKNEILSFAGKWMELENIILSEITQAQSPKIICSPSYVDFRSRANAAMWLDLDHTTRGDHIWDT